MSDEFRVRTADVIRCGHCGRGFFAWCKEHGFNYRLACREGIPSAEIAARNCAWGNRVLAIMRAEREDG